VGRRSREDWREILAELERSGEPVVAFCEKRGIRVGLLKWWRWQLRRGSKSAKKARTGKRRKIVAKAAKDVRLVPVTVLGVGTRREETLTVVISDLQVRVEIGTDVAYVGALVRELRSGC
jgi:hypothetical protein